MLESAFMPQGHCYSWTPSILWSYAISDIVMALLYFSIFFALFVVTKRRSDLQIAAAVKLFALFVFCCGLGHLADVWNIWHSGYGFSSIIRLFTAATSVIVAIVVYLLIPQVSKIPPVAVFKREIDEKEKVERELEDINRNLEDRIAKRTSELESQKGVFKRTHDVMVDREHDMIVFKKEVNQLYKRLGEAKKYVVVTGE